MANLEILSYLASEPTALDWVSAVITLLTFLASLILLFVAWLAARIAVLHIRHNTLTALLGEISGPQASRDRGLVRYRIDEGASRKEIRPLIDAVRNEVRSESARLGKAAERTIARLDRVAFFLLGNVEKKINRILYLKPFNLTVNPPDWLWTHVYEVWQRLGDWIEYRQTDTDSIHYYEGYALYLGQLAEMAKSRRRQEKPVAK